MGEKRQLIKPHIFLKVNILIKVTTRPYTHWKKLPVFMSWMNIGNIFVSSNLNKTKASLHTKGKGCIVCCDFVEYITARFQQILSSHSAPLYTIWNARFMPIFCTKPKKSVFSQHDKQNNSVNDELYNRDKQNSKVNHKKKFENIISMGRHYCTSVYQTYNMCDCRQQ